MSAMNHPVPLAHGPIVPVVDGVFLVRGAFQMGPLMRIGRTMTVVQQGDELTIVNAVRLSPQGEARLERLGKVKHLVKLSDSHGIDEPYYADRYAPEVWTLPGAKVNGFAATRELGPASPIAGSVVVEFPGATGWREVALWLPQGAGTLVSCDALQNHADAAGANWFGRVMGSILGFKGGVIVAPMWRRFQKVQGAALEQAFAPATMRPFANLVTGHGPAVVGGADQLVRRAIKKAMA
jgi:hypothetical protein